MQTPQIWADGFDPKPFPKSAPKCGPGNKPCGRRCIANHMKCYIGRGKVGLAQKALGVAAVGGAIHQLSKGNTLGAAALGVAGTGLMARGSYNLGLSAGQSREAGSQVKSALGYPDVLPGVAFGMGLQEGRKNLTRRTPEGKLRRTRFQRASQNSVMGTGALVNQALRG
jgi:hypothetical protein